jgi:nucleoside triphosphate pyrophosphatase
VARIVLASGSASRASLLHNAGVDIEIMPPNLDERAVEAPLAAAKASPRDIAAALADAKALAVVDGDAFVIGADQVLAAGDQRWNKPATIAEARDQLAALAGHSHDLHSAVAVVRNGTIIWRYSETARMAMRALSSAEIDAYLDRVGDKALTSVGAYQLEGPGIQLFEKIEGDYFAILGLPLLPLLSYLRGEGAIS